MIIYSEKKDIQGIWGGGDLQTLDKSLISLSIQLNIKLYNTCKLHVISLCDKNINK